MTPRQGVILPLNDTHHHLIYNDSKNKEDDTNKDLR